MICVCMEGKHLGTAGRFLMVTRDAQLTFCYKPCFKTKQILRDD